MLTGRQTIAPDRGLFLDYTWRLHPTISRFTSDQFYDGRLVSRYGLERQAITGTSPFVGSGLAYVPIEHYGNQSQSDEEVEAVYGICETLLDGGHSWINFDEVFGIQLLDCDFVEGGIGWAGSFNTDEFIGGMYKYTPSTDPDLACSGSLDWVDVTPGETVTGSFNVQNIGGPTTLLDWEILSEPEWGTWSFDPDSGLDVAPGDVITVNVEVIAPEDKETEFDGEITIVNSENQNDTCIIDVSLATPVSQPSVLIQFLTRITERFPNAFPIIKLLLGI